MVRERSLTSTFTAVLSGDKDNADGVGVVDGPPRLCRWCRRRWWHDGAAKVEGAEAPNFGLEGLKIYLIGTPQQVKSDQPLHSSAMQEGEKLDLHPFT